jgi:hypothetical protein
MYWSGLCWPVVANIFHMASAPKTQAYTPSTTTPRPRFSKKRPSAPVWAYLSFTGLEGKMTPVVIADIDGQRPTEGSDPAVSQLLRYNHDTDVLTSSANDALAQL